jgi:zonular occludens toxin Zot
LNIHSGQLAGILFAWNGNILFAVFVADYAIIGKKGAGKSLCAVGFIREALVKNKRVATNLNINLDALMHHSSGKTITRLPDHPTVHDLEAIGRGQAGVVEDDNGIIVLDETSHFMNARQYQDKGRQSVLDWLTESRKVGWDVYYIMQGLRQMDAQVRETQIEYVVHIKKTDKWPIPVVTPLTSFFFGSDHAIRFPKMHIAVIRQGIDRDALLLSRHFFKSVEFYSAYDTQQRFRPQLPVPEVDSDGRLNCPDYTGLSLDRFSPGLHSVLSAWHLKGRYLPKRLPRMVYLKAAVYGLLWLIARAIGQPIRLEYLTR